MPDWVELSAELHDINVNLVNLNRQALGLFIWLFIRINMEENHG